jgi:3-oxoadipate enol-lactonase/4-carboxymuconolactone decarboxylase
MTFTDVRGVATHIAIEGPPGAPALLLLHSLGSSLRIWDLQAERLARSLRVVRFDLRGHGLSEVAAGRCTIEDLADDALAVLDACGIAAAHVAGVSIGGMIAQALAARAPARTLSLILCDTALALPPPEMWRARAATVRTEGIAAVAAAEALAVADLSRSTPQLRLPTLVLVGEHDPSTPVAAAEALRDAIPGAQLAVIPGAMHIPMVERPDDVSRAILDFLTPRDAELAAAGLRVRTEVLGAAHVARATAAVTDLDRDFQAYITRAAWGGVWARPHFDRRTRSIITVGVLAALGREHELALHLRAMKNTGASAADISELMLHVAVYAGVPAANAALRVAKQVAEESP